MKKNAARRGFTILLGFLALLFFVFASLMAQTQEIMQLLNLQKQAFSSCQIEIETVISHKIRAEKGESVH